jgi:Uma2 family endonuclease
MATATLLPESETATDTRDLSELLYEVIDGIIVEKPPMGAYEMSLAFRFGIRLSNFVDPLRIGQACVEMLFDFQPIIDRQRKPDAAFVSAERWPVDRPVPRKAAWRVVPDLAVEVISPSNLAGEMAAKVAEYFLVGVSRVWVVYPESGQIYAYDSADSVRIVSRGQVLTDDAILPGFRLDLDEFFGPVE